MAWSSCPAAAAPMRDGSGHHDAAAKISLPLCCSSNRFSRMSTPSKASLARLSMASAACLSFDTRSLSCCAWGRDKPKHEQKAIEGDATGHVPALQSAATYEAARHAHEKLLL